MYSRTLTKKGWKMNIDSILNDFLYFNGLLKN